MTITPISQVPALSLRTQTPPDFRQACVESPPLPWPKPADDSDAHSVDELLHAFRASGYAQLRRIDIHVDDGCANLQGQVPTYFLKQFAQSLALAFPGIRQVENEIEVVSPR